MEEEKGKFSIKVPKINLWMVLSLVLAVSLLVVIVTGWPLNMSSRAVEAGALTASQAKTKAIDYINNNLVQPGTSASAVSVEDIGWVYKIVTSYQGSEIDIFITKDGSYLFLQGFDTTEEIAQEESEPEEVPKSDRPDVHGFVMSYCPYGLQFIKAYIPVMELLGDKADLELNFVDYAMHDKKEINENTRMYCIQKEQGHKLTEYLRCFVETDDYEKCLNDVGIDKTKLESCISSTDEEFKITELYNDQSTWLNGAYPQYPVDAVLANMYGVGGSPTFIVNGMELSVNRSPEAIKQAVCSAFNNPPEECSQTLSTTTEDLGIGPMGSGTGSAPQSQC